MLYSNQNILFNLYSPAYILFVNYSKSRLGGFDQNDVHFKEGLNEFKEGNWDLQVDRLHLPDREIQSDLLDFLNKHDFLRLLKKRTLFS